MKLSDFKITEPIPDEVLGLVKEYLKSGELFRYIQETSEVTKLEQEFAKYLGVRFALAVNSCSSALFLALLSLGVRPNDRVIVPAFTFGAVPSSIVHAGATPVLVEVTDNYRVDIGDFENIIKENVRAVIISHMRGHTSDMDAITKICSENNVPLIEDAAHSLGSKWQGKKVGSIGSVGCFSFQSYKLINGGEGGMLVTNSEDVIAKAVIMSGAYENNWRNHNFNFTNIFEKYENRLPIYNMRLNNLSAILIRAQISLIEDRARRGLEKVNYLKALLSRSKLISIPEVNNREEQSPDSIQFNLIDFSKDEASQFMKLVRDRGLSLYVLGLHEGNARVFWNWKFLGDIPELPKTKRVLMKACDMRVPLTFDQEQLRMIAETIISTLSEVKNKNVP